MMESTVGATSGPPAAANQPPVATAPSASPEERDPPSALFMGGSNVVWLGCAPRGGPQLDLAVCRAVHRGPLQVGIAEFKHDLRIADRKALFVPDPSPKDETVIVETEVGCIDEEHFPNLNGCVVELSG
jgi:hypothetical protein